MYAKAERGRWEHARSICDLKSSIRADVHAYSRGVLRLLFGLAEGLLVRRLELGLDLRHDRLVGLVLHAELACDADANRSVPCLDCALESERRTLALGDAAEMVRVPKHVVQSDLRNARELILANLAVHDRAAALIDPTDDST